MNRQQCQIPLPELVVTGTHAGIDHGPSGTQRRIRQQFILHAVLACRNGIIKINVLGSQLLAAVLLHLLHAARNQGFPAPQIGQLRHPLKGAESGRHHLKGFLWNLQIQGKLFPGHLTAARKRQCRNAVKCGHGIRHPAALHAAKPAVAENQASIVTAVPHLLRQFGHEFPDPQGLHQAAQTAVQPYLLSQTDLIQHLIVAVPGRLIQKIGTYDDRIRPENRLFQLCRIVKPCLCPEASGQRLCPPGSQFRHVQIRFDKPDLTGDPKTDKEVFQNGGRKVICARPGNDNFPVVQTCHAFRIDSSASTPLMFHCLTTPSASVSVSTERARTPRRMVSS